MASGHNAITKKNYKEIEKFTNIWKLNNIQKKHHR